MAIGKLRFVPELRPNPYEGDPSAVNDIWGSFSIIIINGSVEQLLWYMEWDLLPFKKWMYENQDAIRAEKLSINDWQPTPEESISRALNRFYNRFGDDEEITPEWRDWYDQLYNYRQRHELWCAFRGTIIPDIMLGINRGVGEISLLTRKEEWSYQFDMDEFWRDLKPRLKRIVK